MVIDDILDQDLFAYHLLVRELSCKIIIIIILLLLLLLLLRDIKNADIDIETAEGAI